MLFRLLKRAVRECLHVTTPEVVLSIIFAAAAFVFKWLLGGGLSLQDVMSVVIPLVWTICLIGGLLVFKAARHVHKEDIESWTQWKPAIPEAKDLRPLKPSATSTVVTTAIAEVFFTAIIILTFALGKSPRQKHYLPWAKIMFAASGDYAVMINPATEPLDAVGFQISLSHAAPEHKANPSLVLQELATAWSGNVGTLRPEMATPLGSVPVALRPNKDKPTLYQIRIYTRYENFTEWLYLSPRDQGMFNQGLSVYRDKTHETLENTEETVMHAWKNWPEWWK